MTEAGRSGSAGRLLMEASHYGGRSLVDGTFSKVADKRDFTDEEKETREEMNWPSLRGVTWPKSRWPLPSTIPSRCSGRRVIFK